MSILDIILKILLFFTVFYGAILITSLLTKKFREEEALNEKKAKKDANTEIDKEKKE